MAHCDCCFCAPSINTRTYLKFKLPASQSSMHYPQRSF